MAKLGKWAFVGGLVLAVVAGLGLDQIWVAWVLALLGLAVGFLNITTEETHGFLLAAIALMLSATAVEDVPFIGDVATQIILNLVLFIAAAVLVVALKTIFQTTKN